MRCLAVAICGVGAFLGASDERVKIEIDEPTGSALDKIAMLKAKRQLPDLDKRLLQDPKNSTVTLRCDKQKDAEEFSPISLQMQEVNWSDKDGPQSSCVRQARSASLSRPRTCPA